MSGGKKMAVLVTGGARSGKSIFAEMLAVSRGDQGVYVATAQIYDEEMRERMELHRNRRDDAALLLRASASDVSHVPLFSWQTIEEPYQLAEQLSLLAASLSSGSAVLVDCLTLWLSNWLLHYEQDGNAADRILVHIDELAEVVKAFRGILILVTNEVGDGIVPEYPLGRVYRDLAGLMNQRIAAVCDEVFLVTVGIPIELKSIQYKLQKDGKNA